jgi:arabinofuranosyltransferase
MQRSSKWLAAAALLSAALLSLHANHLSWLCDDAFISFRYARNLVEGHGLVFNRGERVEGYTNFLWVLELAALHGALGLSLPSASILLSALYTAGTLFCTAWLAARASLRSERAFAIGMALLLLAVHRSFAVWCTSGLETRQFTFFVLLSVLLLADYASGASRAAAASLALAACEATRPEGLLVFGCCLIWLLADAGLRGRLNARLVAAFVGPFGALVAGHFAFRWWYYGDLLPNTYYAKHVQPWYEGGTHFFAKAGIETGLYFLLPLALLGAFAAVAQRRDSIHVLSLLCVSSHAAYLWRIGGDHFEFRPLDFYWPLLTVAGIEGCLGMLRPIRSRGHASGLKVGLIGAWLLCANAMQLRATGSPTLNEENEERLLGPLRREDYPLLFVLPPVCWLVPLYNASTVYCWQRGIALPQTRLKDLWLRREEDFAAYGPFRNCLPSDSVACMEAAGIGPYYLADLTVIDLHGLTDRHIARETGDRENEERYLAHDRMADRPYLLERGLNIDIGPSRAHRNDALVLRRFALRLAERVWMPFDVLDRAWAAEAFGGRTVFARELLAELGTFRSGSAEGWEFSGEAMALQPREARARTFNEFQHAVQLDWQPSWSDDGWLLHSGKDGNSQATGTARSPAFVAQGDTLLEFRLGGRRHGVGVALLDQDQRLAAWQPHNEDSLRTVAYDLTPHAGRTLRIEVFDNSTQPRGHVLADDFAIVAIVRAGT